MMKKVFVIILTLLLLLFCFVACTQEPPTSDNAPQKEPTYEIFEIGEYGYLSEAEHSVELNVYGIKTYTDSAKVGSTRSFTTPDGKTVEGVYQETEETEWYNGIEEQYIHSYEEGNIFLGWNPTTNQMSFYQEAIFDDKYDPTAPQKSEAECLAIAKQYLHTLTNDVDQYIVEASYDDYYEKYGMTTMNSSYLFDFTKTIDGVLTFDSIHIRVDVFGKIRFYRFFGFGMMEGEEEAPRDEIITMIQGKMDSKLLTIYQKYANDYTLDYEWDPNNIRLLKMKDGRVALRYYVTVDVLKKENNESVYLDEHVELFVYLEA